MQKVRATHKHVKDNRNLRIAAILWRYCFDNLPSRVDFTLEQTTLRQNHVTYNIALVRQNLQI